MLETILTHAAAAVVAAAWAALRVRPPGCTFIQAVKLVVSFGPRPTTPK